MTLEELQAKVKELAESNESLAAKNRELLTEVKTFKAKAKGAEIDPAEYEQLKAELEEARGNLSKVDKLSKSEIEKLNNAVKTKDAALQNFMIDGGLSDALAKAGVNNPAFLDAAKALLRGKAAIKADGESYQAVIGDKPLFDAVKEWASSDTGKHFVGAPANSGGGSQGGSQNAANKTITRSEWEARPHAERSSMAKEGYKVVD
jgi:hypothetical protein